MKSRLKAAEEEMWHGEGTMETFHKAHTVTKMSSITLKISLILANVSRIGPKN